MSEKVNVLFDLNIDGDCTNLGALAVLNVLANQGKANILATTACFDSPLATGCIKALNRYYGHPDIPVGLLHRQKATHPTNFLKCVNKTFCPDHPEGEEVPDTVEVMRRALAKEEDGSVVFVVVGCLASVEALLKSGPDDISPLSGQELADKKITRMVVMGGQFPIFDDKIYGENNIIVQIPAAQYAFSHWNSELVLIDHEFGIHTRTLKEFVEFGSPAHPLRMMYRILDGVDDENGVPSGPIPENGNPTWDHLAVLEAVEPGKHFDYQPYGYIDVDDAGVTTWHEKEGGKHTYLRPKDGSTAAVAAYVNDLIFPEWRKYAK